MFSLSSPAVRGVLWTVAAYGSSQVLRFGNNLILTRLLVPEFFGLMALVNSLRMGLELFSDVGIGQNIIQSPRGDESQFLNTAWSIQILRGIVLWSACLLVAQPMAEFYDEPQLAGLIAVVCLTLLLSGFSSTKLYTLNRKMTLGKLTALELSKQSIGLVAMLVWALVSPTVWALAAGAIAAGVFKLASSHLLIPGKLNRLEWDGSAARELLSFGKWIFIASIMMFLAEQSDRLILGKLLSLEMLGVLTVAFVLAELPKQVLKRIGFKVIFPLVSRKAALPRAQLRARFLQQRKYILLGVVALLLLLVGFGDVLVGWLYDDRYADAAWAVPILSCGAWLSALFYTSSPCLLGLGKPQYSAQSNFLRFLAIVVGVPAGFYVAGTLGAIVAIGTSDLPTYAAIQVGLTRENISTLRQDMAFTGLFVGALAAVLLLRLLLGIELPFDRLGGFLP